MQKIPHAKFVQTITMFLLVCFAALTGYVIRTSEDATIIGGLILTWNNLAVGAAAFWLASSSGGKLKGFNDVNDVQGTMGNVGDERRIETISEVRGRSRIVIDGVNDDLEGMQTADLDNERTWSQDGTTTTKREGD